MQDRGLIGAHLPGSDEGGHDRALAAHGQRILAAQAQFDTSARRVGHGLGVEGGDGLEGHLVHLPRFVVGMVVGEIGAGHDKGPAATQRAHQGVGQDLGVLQRRLANDDRHDAGPGTGDLEEGQLVLHRVLAVKGIGIEADMLVGGDHGPGHVAGHGDRAQGRFERALGPDGDLGRSVAGVRVADDGDGGLLAAGLFQGAIGIAGYGTGIEVAGVGHDDAHQAAGDGIRVCPVHIRPDAGAEGLRAGRIPASGALGRVDVLGRGTGCG